MFTTSDRHCQQNAWLNASAILLKRKNMHEMTKHHHKNLSAESYMKGFFMFFE